MKLSNYENVDKVIKALARIDAALKECAGILASPHATHVDCGGVEGLLETGHGCLFSLYSDGSAPRVLMNGCYVAVEMAMATEVVLAKKRNEVLEWLEDNGVDINE